MTAMLYARPRQAVFCTLLGFFFSKYMEVHTLVVIFI